MTLTHISLKAECFNYPRREEKFLTFFIIIIIIIIILLHLALQPTADADAAAAFFVIAVKRSNLSIPPQPVVSGFNLHATSAINIYRRLKKKRK